MGADPCQGCGPAPAGRRATAEGGLITRDETIQAFAGCIACPNGQDRARLAGDPLLIPARPVFAGTPVGLLFDLPVNGRRVRFTENVFYECATGSIGDMWSVIDKAAIAAQL